eukprot:CAMPEP_0113514816 /NCGR_PEP_ID=MMETSP0014_2-20120614/40612_1 /TAXON_ID=2857 /ORGANISM="Nitzschia sp." /LENGTH=1567 /DNA_ID=CAMNT_0000411341 /DNA_START=287 /DNA_END=4990 /DNA_ORIENTATION=+ /assembly_acc=CAM_ASM_000159
MNGSNISGAPAGPAPGPGGVGATTSWDEHYRRKGTYYEQFQYTSEEFFVHNHHHHQQQQQQYMYSQSDVGVAPAPALGAAGSAPYGQDVRGGTSRRTQQSKVLPNSSSKNNNSSSNNNEDHLHHQLFPSSSDEPRLLASSVTYQPRPLPAWMMNPSSVQQHHHHQQQRQHHQQQRQRPGDDTAAAAAAATAAAVEASNEKYRRSVGRNTMFYPTTSMGLHGDDFDQEGTNKAMMVYDPYKEDPVTRMVTSPNTTPTTTTIPAKPDASTPITPATKTAKTTTKTTTTTSDPASIPYQHQSYSSTMAPRRRGYTPPSTVDINNSKKKGAIGNASGTGNAGRPPKTKNRSVRQQEYYDFVRENLIMFGDGIDNDNTVSTGTGLSQEELLQRKRREDSWRRRKERRNHERKVQLPSSLLFGNSTGSNSGTKTAMPKAKALSESPPPPPNTTTTDRSSPSLHTLDTSGAVAGPVVNAKQQQQQSQSTNTSSTRKPTTQETMTNEDGVDEFGLPIFYNSDEVATTKESSTKAVQKDAGSTKGVRFSEAESSGGDSDKNSNVNGGVKNNSANVKKSPGSRSSMVRRQRGDKSSSGRRWKIVRVEEEPDGINANVDVPGATKPPSQKADPPIERVRTELLEPHVIDRPKVPVDPPSSSEHRRSIQQIMMQSTPSEVISEPSEVVTEIGQSPYLGHVAYENDEKDDFDRYMESSSIRTLTSGYDPELTENSEEDDQFYPPRPSSRPTSDTFTPKSGYSRHPLRGKEEGVVLKPSPTSVLGFQSPGVRWSDTLTQQEIVTPESVKLYPYSAEKIRSTSSSSQPKSILRSNETRRLRKESSESGPSDEKRIMGIAAETGTERSNDSSPESPADIAFFDTSGRSVSPIPGETSMNADDGNDVEDDPGLLSDSYVNFIEAVAAVVIQTKVRQYLATVRVERLRWNQQAIHGNTRALNVSSRRVVQTSNATKMRTGNGSYVQPGSTIDILALAAIQIQATFRGWWVRDCIAVDHYCATMIQKNYRGFLYRTRYLHLMYSIVTVQSLWRRQIARKQVRRRKMDLIHFHTFDHAATTIQAKWRSFVCEMKYLRDYEDVLVVQSVARGWIARRLIGSWLRTHHHADKSRIKQYLKKKSVDPRSNFSSSRQKPVTPTQAKAAGKEISPSYFNHLEYMMTNVSKPDARSKNAVRDGEKSGIKPIQRQLFAMDSDPFDDNIPSDLAPADEELADREISALSLPEASSGRAAPQEPASKNNRDEIEKRRKLKELESKALYDEERRRKEIQAAALAELEMRRKRMALKAAERKRQKEALSSSPPENDKNTFESSNEHESAMAHSFSEEKKEADPSNSSSENKEGDNLSGPEGEDRQAVAVSPDGKLGSPSTPERKTVSSGAKKLLAKWQKWDKGGKPPALQESLCDDTFTGDSVKETPVKLPVEEETAESVSTVSVKSTPVKTPLNRKSDILDALDDAAKHVSPFSPRMPNTTDLDQTFDSAQQTDKSCSIGSHARGETDAIYTAGDSKPRQRVSGTNATYHAHMLLQRSEEEQKRIDGMHGVFKRAGLMNRMKAHQPSPKVELYCEEE